MVASLNQAALLQDTPVLHDSEERHVIALRAARGEDDFRLAAVEQPRNAFPGMLDSGSRLLPMLMDRRRVAKALEQPRTHRLEHLGKQRRRSIRIHVDSAHSFILRDWPSRHTRFAHCLFERKRDR